VTPDPNLRGKTPRAAAKSKLAILVVPAAVLVSIALLALRLYFQPPTVPPYELAPLKSGPHFRAGERFELHLRPSAPVTGAVAARAFLLRGDEVRPWDPPFEVERDGEVRIAGPVDVLFSGVPAGEWIVAVSVGRPEVLPTAPKDVLRARDADPDAGRAAWRLVQARIWLGA
jgi:hypothetical protein